ncbi:MAG TPA: alpha/beta hydrolase [Acidimicrobiales bacterium]|nr:alpha/beta hydrolase [Acidimicrobiales bacterium]
MPRWTAPDGVALAYEVHGEGPAVALLHGFASNSRINWERPGVVQALIDAGHTVVTYDARGHGGSDAPHDPAAYAGETLVGDAVGLLAALGRPDADLVGYSMGAQVAVRVAATVGTPRRLVLGGVGDRLLGPAPVLGPAAGEIVAALEADDPATVPGATGRSFRAFADATKADRLALAALQRAWPLGGPAPLAELRGPVLIVVGTRDTLAGDPDRLAASITGARVTRVPGDHLSAVVSAEFSAAVTRFLES